MRSRLVLVFARLPREESRAKPLVGGTPRRVEALYEKLFRHTLSVAHRTDATIRLVTQGALPPRLATPGLEVVQQVGETFAERLEYAVADAFSDGWQEVVLIGGDAPALERAHLRDAFSALDASAGRSAVIGPACDGGYYLLALNAFSPALFSEVPLGTAEAGRATEDVLAREGFSLSRLAPLHDLDDERDLERIARTPGFLRAAAASLLVGRTLFATVAVTPVRRFVTTISARGPPQPAAT